MNGHSLINYANIRYRTLVSNSYRILSPLFNICVLLSVGSMGQSAGPDGNWSESSVNTDCHQVGSLPPESIYG